MKPKRINIMGIEYTVRYVEKPSDVDLYGRESLWGQVDYWTRTIRVYDKGDRSDEDIWVSILHEILHAIGQQANLSMLKDKANHEQLDLLGSILVDVFFRNGWIGDGVQKKVAGPSQKVR